jgi:hypothetical protein
VFTSLSDKVGAESTLALGKVWASDALKLLRSRLEASNSSSASGLHREKNVTLQRLLGLKFPMFMSLFNKIGDGMQSKRFKSNRVNDCGSDTSTRPEGVNVGSSVEESKFPSLSKSLKLLSRSRNLQHHHFGQRSFSDVTQSGDGATSHKLKIPGDDTHVKEGGNVTPLSDVIRFLFILSLLRFTHTGQRSFSDATQSGDGATSHKLKIPGDDTHVKEGGNVTPLSDVIRFLFSLSLLRFTQFRDANKMHSQGGHALTRNMHFRSGDTLMGIGNRKKLLFGALNKKSKGAQRVGTHSMSPANVTPLSDVISLLSRYSSLRITHVNAKTFARGQGGHAFCGTESQKFTC